MAIGACTEEMTGTFSFILRVCVTCVYKRCSVERILRDLFTLKTTGDEMRNVEIKAKVRNIEELVSRAEQLSNSKGVLIRQDDTFYNVPQGRLKLRKFEDGTSQLIHYNRPDTEGPKLCNYSRVDFPAGSDPGPVLAQALGIKGTVKKARMLYLVDKTRIHIDQVFGLGTFMELEVVLTEDQPIEEGQAVAEDIRRKLGVDESDLLSGAYMDMLLKR